MADELHRRVATLEQQVEHHGERLNRHDEQIGRLIGIADKHDQELAWLDRRARKRLASKAPVRRRTTPKK